MAFRFLLRGFRRPRSLKRLLLRVTSTEGGILLPEKMLECQEERASVLQNSNLFDHQ